MITYYVAGRQRFAVAAAMAGAFLFGCFTIGVFSCRGLTPGQMLICLLFCLVVYLTKPQWMVWCALFASFASLPESLHIGKDLGMVTIYLYQVAIVLAAIFLIPASRLRRSSYILPGMFLATMVCWAIVGLAAGNPTDRVLREFQFLFELVGGFVLAMLVIDAGYAKEAMRAIGVTLWFSAGMLVAASFHLVVLAGRTETVEKGLGAAEATRLVTSSQNVAIAVLTALIAAQIVGRVTPATYLMLAPPALVITLLAFARHSLLLMGVAGVVALLASPGWHGLRRTAMASVTGAAILAVTISGSLLLLKHSSAGAWLGDQFTTFNNRVLHNVSGTRFAVDPSILAREAENTKLGHKIGEAPIFGHGLGYPYQLPFGKPDSFTATLGTTYSHNFYLWWLAKAGAVGMTAFALFALVPIVRGLLSASTPAKAAAAVAVALLVNCTVDPLPEDGGDALALGLALGAALQFAVVSRRARSEDNAIQRASPSCVTGARAPAIPA
ncbi:MAG TPA: O-antigen ligase family protein [Candidatus Baltobacteraceae bacterium]|nr:O-antigen ligase family protein [Candidatus Baltobacteraceae bacterium]